MVLHTASMHFMSGLPLISRLLAPWVFWVDDHRCVLFELSIMYALLFNRFFAAYKSCNKKRDLCTSSAEISIRLKRLGFVGKDYLLGVGVF